METKKSEKYDENDCEEKAMLCGDCLREVGRIHGGNGRIRTPLKSLPAERNCVSLMHHVDC